MKKAAAAAATAGIAAILAAGMYRIQRGSGVGEVRQPGSGASAGQLSVCGWIPWWDWEKGVAEFNRHRELFDVISPMIYMVDERGRIVDRRPEGGRSLEKEEGLLIMPTVYNDFDGERVSAIFNSETDLTGHVEELAELIEENDYDGIDIDYEYLKDEDREVFVEFIRRLAERLHDGEKLLAVTVLAKLDDEGQWYAAKAQNWVGLAKYADFIRIMAYDFHWSESEPGPISPVAWVADVTAYARQAVPAQKRVLGMGLYGYGWKGRERPAREYTLERIEEMLESTGVRPEFDPDSQSPYFRLNEDGSFRVVWYEDDRSIKAKFDLIKSDYRGVCIWRLGGVPDGMYDLYLNETEKKD